MPDHSPTQAAPPKSMAAALVLTFFFGPLGLFYVDTKAALIMCATGFVIFILSIVTFGLAGFLFIVPWFGSMLWAALMVDKANAQTVTTVRG